MAADAEEAEPESVGCASASNCRGRDHASSLYRSSAMNILTGRPREVDDDPEVRVAFRRESWTSHSPTIPSRTSSSSGAGAQDSWVILTRRDSAMAELT